jgi:hypothetical protein
MSTRNRTLLAAAALAVLPALAGAKDPAIVIEAVKVEQKTATTGKMKGNEYLRVSFDTTVNEATPKTYIRLKAKATVDDKTMTDNFMASGNLDNIAAGTTKAMSAVPFMGEGLGGTATKVELTFMVVKTLEKTGPTVAEFCWTGGSKAKPGACE